MHNATMHGLESAMVWVGVVVGIGADAAACCYAYKST